VTNEGLDRREENLAKISNALEGAFSAASIEKYARVFSFEKAVSRGPIS
jgi:hypothetical protein